MTDIREVPSVPRASMFLFDPLDSEETRLTRIAHHAARNAVLELQGISPGAHPTEFITLPSGEEIVWEVRGQSSVTGHGKQGLRPERIHHLHRLAERGYPILLDFIEGWDSYRRAWLHDLPAAQPISLGQDGDPASKRFGWSVSEMEKRTGHLKLPDAVPERKPRAQEALV